MVDDKRKSYKSHWVVIFVARREFRLFKERQKRDNLNFSSFIISNNSNKLKI